MIRRLMVWWCLVLVALMAAPGAAAARRTIYVFGRVIVHFQGWQGKQERILSGLVVKVERRRRRQGRAIRVYQARTDAAGYYFLARVPRRGLYLVRSVSHSDRSWTIRGRGGIAAGAGPKAPYLVLGTYTYAIDAKGHLKSYLTLAKPKDYVRHFRGHPRLRRVIRLWQRRASRPVRTKP